MSLTASIFAAPGLAGIAAVGVASFWLARRRWELALAACIAADVATWSWLSWLKTAGNVVYWGAAAGIGLALARAALSSPLARRLLVGSAAVTGALAATSLWSVSTHQTLRESATLGSVLVVVSFVATRLRDAPIDGRIIRTLSALVPAVVVCTAAVIVADHAAAVAEGGGVSGFLNGANALGLVIALCLPFLLADARLSGGSTRLLVVMGATAFVVVLSGSRTGFAAAVAAFAVFELGRREWRRLALGGAAAAAGAALAIAWTPAVPTLGRPIVVLTSPSGRPVSVAATPRRGAPAQASQLLGGGRPPGQSLFGSLTGGRDEAWRAAVDLLPRKPLIGTGFGTGSSIFAYYGVRGRFRDFVGAFDPQANVHEGYLQALLELGIPGGLVFLAPFLAACGVAVVRMVRGWRTSLEGVLAAAVAAALVCGLFESIFAGLGPMTLLAWLGAAGVLSVSGAGAAARIRGARDRVATVLARPGRGGSGTAALGLGPPAP